MLGLQRIRPVGHREHDESAKHDDSVLAGGCGRCGGAPVHTLLRGRDVGAGESQRKFGLRKKEGENKRERGMGQMQGLGLSRLGGSSGGERPAWDKTM